VFKKNGVHMKNKIEKSENSLKTPSPKSGNRFIVRMALGLILVVSGLMMIFAWWRDLWVVVRGCAGVLVVLAAAVVLAMARE
jgi:hypothetical protein